MTLLTNRYSQVTPTNILSNGCSVSTPVYFKPTQDQAKELLNAFREKVRQQRQELGWSDEAEYTSHGVRVSTKTKPPLTQVEDELGMNEESLRYSIFGKTGIPERLFLKLCFLTGVQLVSRESIEETIGEWLDHLFEHEQQRTKAPDTKGKRTKRTTKPSGPAS